MTVETPVFANIRTELGTGGAEELNTLIEDLKLRHGELIADFPEEAGLITEITVYELQKMAKNSSQGSRVESVGMGIRRVIQIYSNHKIEHGNWDNNVIHIRFGNNYLESFDADTATGSIFYIGAPRPALDPHAATQWYKHGSEIVRGMRVSDIG